MDLGAYANIGDCEISEIANRNGISVPRLRGYRLMATESLVSDSDIKEMFVDMDHWTYTSAMCSSPVRFRPDSHGLELSPATDRLKKKYLIYEVEKHTRPDGTEWESKRAVGMRWDLIHGKNRKAIKFALKKSHRGTIEQYRVFNKYVGRNDVLYIHARIGGANWDYYGGSEIEQQPWFLEKVDDSFDSTYCDIYAKIS